MIRRIVLAVALLFAVPLLAQNAPAPSPFSNFSLDGSAVGFLGSASGSQPASLVGAWYQTTARVSFGFETIQIPANSSWYFGMAKYQLPLSSLLGKKITAKLKFDASQIGVGFEGGLGKMLQSATAAQIAAPVNRFAGTVGVTVSIPLSSNLAFQAISAQWLQSGVQHGLIVTPSTAAISTGLSLHF